MKIIKNQTVEKLVPGGDGLIRHENKVIFVPGVLPGEKIDLQLSEIRKKFSRGVCTAIHQESPARIKPLCPLYKECGGCNLQHLSYSSQISLKKQFLIEIFQKIAGISLPDDLEFIPSPPFGYRQRVQVHSDGINLGFKARGEDRIIGVKSCPILIPSLNEYMEKTLPSSFEGRKLLLGTTDRVFTEDQEDVFQLTVDDRKISLKASLFFQSNSFILPDLLDFALKDLGGERAMDLYCGVGLFSLFLKDRFSHITAIEINSETENLYRDNMKSSSFQYYGMSLEKWLKNRLYRKSGRIDLIVVDPPRTGLSKTVRHYLTEHPVPHLVYVSCDPSTQARDTKELVEQGYKIETVRGFDFYPQTNHMESVIRFCR